jgi:hypothetical protein
MNSISAWIRSLWQRFLTVGEKDVKRLMNYCGIVGQKC